MRRPLLCLPLLPLLACGGGEPQPPPGRTIDTSCGLDCEAQQRYGLTFDRCFEYTDTAEAQEFVPLAVHVLPQLATLEGDVKSLEVQYLGTGGILKMTDYFVFDDLDLKLVRRKLANANSVSYLDGSDNLVGVTLVSGEAAAGTNLTSDVRARVNVGTSTVEDTTFRVSVQATSDSEKTVPEGTHPDALKLLLSETPDHAPDLVRVFVPELGFIRMDTRLSLTPSDAATTYSLQRVRDVEAGGEDFCGRVEG
jgi:hypothetical protein